MTAEAAHSLLHVVRALEANKERLQEASTDTFVRTSVDNDNNNNDNSGNFYSAASHRRG